MKIYCPASNNLRPADENNCRTHATEMGPSVLGVFEPGLIVIFLGLGWVQGSVKYEWNNFQSLSQNAYQWDWRILMKDQSLFEPKWPIQWPSTLNLDSKQSIKYRSKANSYPDPNVRQIIWLVSTEIIDQWPIFIRSQIHQWQ